MHDTGEEGLQPLIDPECIHAIAQSLLHATYQNRWQRSGIVGLINRTLLATQETVVVAVYRKVLIASAECYKFEFHTLWDAYFKTQFEHHLHNFHKILPDAITAGFNTAAHPDLLHQLLDTDIFICLFTVAPLAGDRLHARFIQHPRDATRLSVTLGRISAAYCKQDVFNALSIDNNLQALRNRTAIAALGTRREARAAQVSSLSSADLKILHGGKRVVLDIISDIFLKQRRSPLVHTGFVTNIIYFHKQFTRTNLRFSSYAYDAALVVPDNQAREIAQGLLKHRSALLALPTNNEHPDARAAFAARSETNEGCLMLVRELSAPLSCHVRSVAEYPLAAGFFNVREDPADREGFNIVNASYDDAPGDHLSNLLLRRIFWLMGGGEERERNVVQVPIRIAGAPALCAVSVVSTHRRNGHSPFWHPYYLANSLIDQHVRPLRIRLRESYVDQLCERLLNAARKSINYRIHNHRAISLDSFVAAVNSDWTCLTRLFPYEQVRLALAHNGTGPDILYCLGHRMRIEKVPNMFFDIQNPSNYIKLSDIYSKLQAAISRLEAQSNHPDLLQRVKA
jgi:hypothetical protein